MQAIIDACRSGALSAVPVVVISNNSDSGALARARQESIPCYCLNSKTHASPESLDEAILKALLRHSVDIVVLAGYMKKLGPKTLRRFAGALINIHPALLPKFGGKGMYGIHVHEAVLAANEKETGVSIHLVEEEYDRGPIIAQIHVPVMPDDTPETLAARVLAVEHEIYPITLDAFAKGKVRIEGQKAWIQS